MQPPDIGAAEPAPGPLPTPDEPATRTSRPAWQSWAVGIAIVVFAGLAFVVARGLGHHNNAATAAVNGQNSSNGAAAGYGFGGRFGSSGRPTFGTISAINGSTITVTDASGAAVKINTSASTKVSTTANASVSDIAKGDRIVAVGTTSGSTTAATRITDTGAGGGLGGRPTGGRPFNGNGATPPSGANRAQGDVATGTVIKVAGNTFTIQSLNGSRVTVTASAATTVTKARTATISDLRQGQTVIVAGTTASDGSVAATSITEGATGFGGFGRGGGPGQSPTA